MVISRKTTDEIEKNLAYYFGDHWKFWIGPAMPEGDPKYEEVMGAIAKVFQSDNKIKETIDRATRALVGKSPHWYFADSRGERVEDDTASIAELLLQRWIQKQNTLAIGMESQLSNPIAEATRNLLITGKGYFRLWSPAKYRNSRDLISKVCLHSPHPGSIEVQRDKDGFIDQIIYSYEEDNKTRKEVQKIDSETNLTVFATLDELGNEIEAESFALDLNGNYSIYEMRSPSVLTPSIKQAQNGINYALTMMLRGVEVAGFRERIILGAQPPGRWDDDGNFHADSEFVIGPGRTNFVQGLPLHDENGTLRGYSPPSVSYAEPVSPQTFIDTAASLTSVIYHEMNQSHLLGSDLQLSGVSREQSRSDFEASLGEYTPVIQAAVAGIYNSALMMLVQGDTGFDQYKNLDVSVQLRLSVSKPTPDERSANREDYKAGLRSRTTAMAASGIDNPDGEVALLNEEQRSQNAVEDVTSLLTTGTIDQPTAEELLRSRGVLPGDLNGSDRTGEVLNGN